MAATVDSAMVKQCGRLAESPFPPRSDAALHKRTRIICTLGPSSWDVDMLGVLLDEGMNVARLNFSHGDHETHKRTIGRLKEALAIRPGRHCAIMLDTKGPEIRTGFFAAPNDGGKLKFAKGDPLILTTDYDHKSDGTKLGCTYKKLPTSVKPGGQILVADGSLVLEVVSTDGTAEVTCKIMNDCAIGERKNMNLPGVLVDLPVLQDKDTKDLVEFACPMGVDFVAVSFVQSAADVRTVRKTLDGAGGTKIKIISKIENQEGLDNFASIVDETDSVMVARGDLGMEIPPERVFRAQKSMIATCNGAGKPVIVATQMLESMVSNPRPTRAECSDVANAVLDGADAAEGEFDFDAAYQKELATMRESGQDKGDSTSLQPSRDAAAKAIVVLAASGATTQLFAKYKCGIPALIPGAYVLHVPDLVKYGYYADDTGDDEPKMVAEGTKFACSLGLVTSGDDFLCAVHSYRVNKQKNIAMRFFHASSVL
ncbi:pyruvate kinase [Aureococcus anophagefferens]|nr:pyruvate kinase [Aureococcus anophagefferens]